MLRILIVEDEEPLATMFSAYLSERMGIETLITMTVRDAVRKLSRETIDGVILDLNLPDSHGVDSAYAIAGETAVPIVILSGINDRETIEKCLQVGAVDYIIKPYSPVSILPFIIETIRRKNYEFAMRIMSQAERQTMMEGLQAKISADLLALSAIAGGGCDE